MLILGVLIPFAAAGVIGAMTVALVTNHIKNGYFIFSKGGGYEYVLNLILATLAVVALGAGRVSIDALVKIDFGWSRLPISLVMGLLSAVLILAIFWRPGRVAPFRND
ncbi:DoxX family protein [Rhodococcus opacus]|nr:DoxX family protein [Rhodococcus opacus]